MEIGKIKFWQKNSGSRSGSITNDQQMMNNVELNKYLTDISYNTVEASEEFTAANSFKKLQTKISEESNSNKLTRILWIRNTSIAASVAILISIILYSVLKEKLPEPKWIIVSNELDQPRELKLPDGSILWLNTMSKVSYQQPFNGKERNVKMVGEVYFEVAKDPGRPFIVTTPHMKIQVLGTQFNLRSFKNSPVVTTLVEGKISLDMELKNKKSEKKIIFPGQQVVLNPEKNTILYKENVDVASYTAWKNRRYIFKQNTIDDIGNLLETEYKVHIIIESKKLRKRKYTGEFEYGTPIEKILNVIKVTTQFNYEIKSDTIFIKD
jgi:ferric-dicitrate binding protein FerR (iron transport regulator)